MTSYKFSLVIPCYNEESSLQKLIPEIIQLTKHKNFEFILVNNGSTDKTNQMFRDIDSGNIRTVTLDENFGYGAGIKAGLEYFLV